MINSTLSKTIFFLLFVSISFSDSFDKVGTTTAQFLKLGVGARAMGMGGAFVALANDGSAAYWNPAGLITAEKMGTQFNHHQWFLDISQEYLSVYYPVNRSTVAGFSITALTMDEKEITTVSQPDGTDLTYSVMDIALTGSVARRLSDRLSYGLNVKYIQSTAYNEIAKTIAFDLGSIFLTDYYGLTIGMAISNFGGEMQYSGTDLIDKADIDDQFDGNIETDANLRTELWPIPLMIRIGIAMNLVDNEIAPIHSDNHILTVAIDAEHPNDAREHLNIGCEYTLYDMLTIRGGYRFNYDLDKLTFGAGFKVKTNSFGDIKVNYAVHPMGIFGQTNQISLELLF